MAEKMKAKELKKVLALRKKGLLWKSIQKK